MPGMGHYPRQLGMKEACMESRTNWPARFAEMLDLVGLSEEDRQLIKASGPLIMSHAGRLNDLVYDQLLQHPQSRKFFVTDDDKPDAKRIEDNKQTMITWLRATATAPLNEGFIRYLVGISQMHRNIPIHRPHLSPVAPRYIIGTISFYQTAIADILHQQMSEPTLASRTSVAWNKWLMVGLELLLAGYLVHDGDD
jgi:hemoglobin-like flavoprotein